ncbi:Biotin carboxylase [bioreactor metagenome]|uniref:Biotin carboxylase n=2 Tax=root TaxID=1 RepID=A0A645H7Q9_9ZZZZ
MIEESPSPVIDEITREKLGNIAVKAAKAVNYENAGTIEFLMDEDLNFYFIEMNTRIQVEHPVTEMVTGVDLIKEQIKIAYGEKLSLIQNDVKIKGHAIECRINAENPANNFLPCPGKITSLNLPGGNGVRVDTFIYCGYKIPINYDSMIGKIIVHGCDRSEAIEKMKIALDELVVGGIETNANFQYSLMNNPVYVKGKANTGFIEELL